jgi:hypothetical protein
MKRVSFIASLLVLAGFCSSGLAQAASEGLASRITAARKANATLMKQYSWSCRAEFIKEGKVLDTRIDSVTYGPDGQLQRTVMNDEKSPLPHGFVRKKVAEKERQDVEKYLVGLRKLLDQYTLPSAGKVLDFVNQSAIQAPDANGMLKLTGSSVVVVGDTFDLWLQAATQRTEKVQITSFFEGETVTANASFKTLASGLSHVAFAEIDVPAKGYRLQIHNFDYNQNN